LYSYKKNVCTFGFNSELMYNWNYAIKFIGLFYLIFLMNSCNQEEEKEMTSSNQEEEKEKPEENRFTKVILAAENIDEPMQLEILEDGRVLIVERKGKIKVFDPKTKELNIIADIPVSIGYYSNTGEVLQPTGEDGMQGVVLDPNFVKNHWIYLYYSPEGGDPRSILTRYEWQGSTLDINSKKMLFEIPNQRESCCHLGGGMLFDADGNLYLSTGDNTPNDPIGYSPLDERSGRNRYDSQRTSSNTNDLRGKILRIHPEPDGTYSIPEGNLFPQGTPKTKPEIYTMGNRNPWRLSIDSKTGWLYWGEVGPSGTTDSIGLGPRSYDEFNQARKAGNFGWPYFSANNKPYWEFDYTTNKSGEKFDSAHPVNNSPNNTGLFNLPPAQPALIWYPQSQAVDFPLLGSGSNSAVGGPIYHLTDFENPKRPFPPYYEGKWFITDWTRGWIMAVSLDRNGEFKSMEQFLPEMELSGPIDMEFGPDGDLYILEYGRSPYKRNLEAQLIRIEYNAGNRKPIAEISADKKAGALPLNVKFSSTGTKDYDNDPLTYEWKITSIDKAPKTFSEANPRMNFHEPGKYLVTLIVSDSNGLKDSTAIEINAGNDPPQVKFELDGANTSFFFPGKTIDYTVKVRDKEDGTLADQQIPSSKVGVSIDYFSGDNDFQNINQSLKNTDALVPLPSILANQVIRGSDCRSCHAVSEKLIGPSFNQVALRYKDNIEAMNLLSEKIIKGGKGNWEAELAMPPHPEITEKQANATAEYILNLNKSGSLKSLPVKGTYITKIPEDEENETPSFFDVLFSERFIFRASYTDNGTEVAPQQSSIDIVVLRNPIINTSEADIFEGIELNHAINTSRSTIIPKYPDSYIGLKNIDLTGIKSIQFSGSAVPGVRSKFGGTIEIRVDSPTGTLIGETTNILLEGKEKESPLAKAVIEETNGVHDVYFIFTAKTTISKPSQMQIRNLEFIDGNAEDNEAK